MDEAPRLVPEVLEVPAFASQYVDVLTPTGESIATATGFFVRGPCRAPYLITNRHVVTGLNNITGNQLDETLHRTPAALRVTMPMAGPLGRWTRCVVRLGDADLRPEWLEHPTHGGSVDVVAIRIDVDEANLDLVTYPHDGPTHARLDLTTSLNIIGFPIGFDPQAALGVLGVWTRGTIAWPPGLDYNGLPSILLDARTRKGQSGSPVIQYVDRFGSYIDQAGGERAGPMWELVGVYSGRIHPDSDLGVVWKRHLISEIVDGGVRPKEPTVSELEADPRTLVPHLDDDPATWSAPPVRP